MVYRKHIVFDWGDTLMKDDRSRDDAMYLWPVVHAMDGAETTLRTLARSSTISVATSAAQSDGLMVRKALRRVGLDQYVSYVFTGKSIGRKKTDPAFWTHIQGELNAQVEELLIVGDSFESDVLAPTRAGFSAVWFNPNSREEKSGDRYWTIHKLDELIKEAESAPRELTQ
jgi:putative hydrolase of the HAD superfamily